METEEIAPMPRLELFVAPHTCAFVPTVALEEIGVPFSTNLVRLAKNQQNDPAFLKLNPKGKVPTLLFDGQPLTENPAILNWLNTRFPEANLMPRAHSDFENAQCLADLLFFSSTVHPAVARYAIPARFYPDKADAIKFGRPMALDALGALYSKIDTRLGPWWYGETWSIVDAYLLWTWRRVTLIGFPETKFPNIARHCALSAERPAIQRAMDREAADIEVLGLEGNYHRPV